MPVPIFLHVDLTTEGSIRMQDVDGVGAGTVEKNTARSTMILLQGSRVRMPRISMESVVGRRRGSLRRPIVKEAIVAIVRRGGRSLPFGTLTTSCTAPRTP